MMFNRFCQLLIQAQESGELIAPLPESDLKTSEGARRGLRLSRRFLIAAKVLLVMFWFVAAIYVCVGLAMHLCSTLADLEPTGVLACLLALGTFVIIVVSGVSILNQGEAFVERAFPCLQVPLGKNLARCAPLSKSECVTMLNLFETVEGGHAYHQALLREGRHVYGFDLELLSTVQGARVRKTKELEEEKQRLRAEEADEQQRQRIAAQEDEACRKIHGIAV